MAGRFFEEVMFRTGFENGILRIPSSRIMPIHQGHVSEMKNIGSYLCNLNTVPAGLGCFVQADFGNVEPTGEL